MKRAYHAFYCEENIWHLAGEPRFSKSEQSFVILISNHERICPLWQQRAAQIPNYPVVWDYHVILVRRPQPSQSVEVWDLDTVLEGPPTPFHIWWENTFPLRLALPNQYNPMFRVMRAIDYRRIFSSNREHMIDDSGEWLVSPPPWKEIRGRSGGHNTLDALLEMKPNDMPGVVFEHEAFAEWAHGD